MRPCQPAKTLNNLLDTRSRRQKIAENESLAKAILPEARSVKKAMSYQSLSRPLYVPISACRVRRA